MKDFLADDLYTLKLTIEEMREEGWEPRDRLFMVPAWHPARRFYIGEPAREPMVGQRMIRARVLDAEPAPRASRLGQDSDSVQ